MTHNLEAVKNSEQQLNDMKNRFKDKLSQLDFEM